jgi:hypothetical protein
MWVPFPDVHDHCTARDTDPLSDLNAMHEAEKMLVKQNKIVAYLCTLDTICKCVRDETRGDQWLIVHATAAELAEAFLRTLNLWVTDAE